MTNKTYRVTNCYEGNKEIEAFESGKKILDIIVNFYDVDGAAAVLEALGYRLTKREY